MASLLFENKNFRLWKDSDHQDRDEVIIKTYSEEFPDPETVMMLRNEFNILDNLEIQGVRKLIKKTRFKDRDALVFEYIDGDSLSEALPKGRYSIREFLQIAHKLSQTLGLIHNAGIIHKDINPNNILISKKKEIYIIDFGIASRYDIIANYHGNPDQLQGNLSYISPEQTGRINRIVDFRSDLYSLGVVFYEMLTGRLPFEAKDPLELIHSHLAVNPKRPDQLDDNIPQVLSDLVLKLLSKNADERYQSAFPLQMDLENCINLFEKEKTIKHFQLGSKHASERFILPQKLYGRTHELRQLTACLGYLGQEQPQIVLLHGEPGVGKSALVNEIQRVISGKRAHFISGKFDQYQRNIPYYAIQKALYDWVQIILSEKNEKLLEWKEIILESVGELGGLIVNLVPEIEIIIGPQPEAPALNSQEAQNRFNYISGNFIRAISRDNIPLIMFIDDLQWADSASLELIRLWLEDKDNRNFLLIGAYRDNEVDESHPLQIVLTHLKEQMVPVTYLKISNLLLSDVENMISDTLFSEKKTIAPLAAFVFEKTGGNPIFIKQFLLALHEEKLIHFVPEKETWVWDIDAMYRLNISDNIIDLMMSKIKRLPGETQNLVKLAACIGSSFDAELLGLIADIPLEEVVIQLNPAIRESLILPKGRNYRFAEANIELRKGDKIELSFIHDRIQQAFYSLNPDEEKKLLHLRIGRLLDKKVKGTRRNEKIFDIVFQLNTGIQFIVDTGEKTHLAGLNLQAGTKALESAAYDTSLELIETGIQLLPENSWTNHYDLNFHLSEKGAEAAYLLGEYEKMNHLIDSVISHSKTIAEQKKVYMLRIDYLTAQNLLPEGLHAGLEILSKLGVSFPKNPKTGHIILGLLKTKWLLKNINPEDLKDLDVMKDPDMIAALPILERIVPPAYMSGSNMFPLIVFKMVELSVKYGNMPYSAFGYASYGISLSAVLGDYESGYRYGQMALQLVEKFESEEYRVKVLFVTDCFLNHWKQHLNLSVAPLLESYKSGLKVGNLVGGIWAAYYHLLWQFYTAEELTELDKKLDTYKQSFAKRKQHAAANRTGILQNLVQNLSKGEEVGLNLAVNKNDDEELMLKSLAETNDKTSLFFYHLNKLLLHVIRLEPAAALQHSSKAKEYKEAVSGLPELTFSTLFESIAYIYSSLSNNNNNYLKPLKSNLKNLKKWSESSPSNYLHPYLIVKAGFLAAKGNVSEAMPLFDEAIKIARKEEFIQIEAMACELAGRIYLKHELIIQGQLFIQKASQTYEYWGAHAKTKMLINEFDFLSSSQSHSSSGQSGSGGRGGWQLDLDTVMKASTAISGEIRFHKLLENLLKIVIENAGAQRAVLLMDQDGEFNVVAHGTIESIEILDGINIEDYKDIPQSLILFSIRTGEELIIPDAFSHHKWNGDDYIRKSEAKSVLCTPIKSQGQTKALLYLENNLAANTFTTERVELLRMLSGQIAISIENAKLYLEMENRVEERTKQLREKNKQIEAQKDQLQITLDELKAAQNQLIHAEKMASLGELTAGIAHEIKNPLNFVNNFSELSKDLVDEMKELLEKGNIPEAIEIVEDVIFNLEKITHHGKRADGIVKSMLQHSHVGSGVMEPANLNSVVKEFVTLAFHGMRAGNHPINVDIDMQLDEKVGEVPLIAVDFSRVIVNLCNNAFDAMRERLNSNDQAPNSKRYSPKLSVRTKSDSGKVQIEIEDNGPGIPDEIKDKILQPFFTTKKGTQGTGLGLSITNDIIKAHGGSLNIHTQPGHTVFTITLTL